MLTDNGILLFVPPLLCLFLFYRVQQIRKVWQAFGNLPAHFVLISPATILSSIAPRIRWISGGDFTWRNSYESQNLPRVSFSTQLMVST